jgi:glycosyltransferase involved in cell wall biosynthesis
MAGVPVIAAARGGIPETVRHEDNGLLYDPARPGALETCMRRLSLETGLLPRLAARSVGSVKTFSDVPRMLDEYVALYEQLTPQRANARVRPTTPDTDPLTLPE